MRARLVCATLVLVGLLAAGGCGEPSSDVESAQGTPQQAGPVEVIFEGNRYRVQATELQLRPRPETASFDPEWQQRVYVSVLLRITNLETRPVPAPDLARFKFAVRTGPCSGDDVRPDVGGGFCAAAAQVPSYLPPSHEIDEGGTVVARTSINGNFARLALGPDQVIMWFEDPATKRTAVPLPGGGDHAQLLDAPAATVPSPPQRVTHDEPPMAIYVMNTDGSAQTNITETTTAERHPRWSPDGRQIVFASYRDGSPHVYVMDADGSNANRLTSNPEIDLAPTWAPGTRIAFTSNRDNNYEIYVMDSDGSGVKRLTKNSASDSGASWSPDGSKIAFASERDGEHGIFVMNADGTEQSRLSDPGHLDVNPAWSPDGSMIAFETYRDGDRQIYVMNADGSGARRVSTNPANEGSPSWSPDGKRLALISERDGNDEVYVMNLDGSDLVRLTTTPGREETPSWSPDGSKMVFAASR